jgi:hypothetical protein
VQLTRRLNANYDMSFGQGLANFAVESDSVLLCVTTRLRVMLGEWFLDTTAGCFDPTTLAQKPPNFGYQQAQAKACILATDGVVSLDAFDMVFSQQTRKLSITFSYTDSYGNVLTDVQVNS